MSHSRLASPTVTPLAPNLLAAIVGSAMAAVQTGIGLLRLPFDTARAQYARSVQAGLVERSMLASRDFEGLLGAMEAMALGPLARRV
jgi:hypothetical protein